jgi:glyoxylate carboligase
VSFKEGEIMQRPIKSRQRARRDIHFIVSADGTAKSGLDSTDTQITVTDTGTGVKTVELGTSGFASADYVVQVTTATADSVAQVAITDANTFVVNTFDSTDGTTAKDAICHISVFGSDVTDRY